jgi:predicted nucleotide-binding protein
MAMAQTAAHDQRPPSYVFIGSSSAALPLSRKIKEKLESAGDIIATVWDEKPLGRGGIVLDELLLYVNSFDFAVLVLSADDLTSRERDGEATPSPRDNVIFELGLFMGVRGRRRIFPVVAARSIEALKIPTDLSGYIVPGLDPDRGDDETYLTEQIGKISQDIKSESKAAALSLLPSAALASGYFNNFLIPVYKHLQEAHHVQIEGQQYDLQKGNYQMVIMLPQSLRRAGIADRDDYVKANGLLPFKFSEGRREYGFFVYPPAPDGIIRFADYPTTLRSSAEIIKLTLQEPRQFGRSAAFEKIQEQMERQEVANFRKALDWLMESSNEVPRLKDKITYEYF